MKQDIKFQWNNLENKRVALMTSLSKYNNDILNKKPTQEVWSTVQVMQHLMNAEMESLHYMKKKLSHSVNIPKAGIKSRLRRFALRIAFVLPFKYKAPQQLEIFPDYSDFEILKFQWASQRLELQDFIEMLPDNIFCSEIWKHPIMGKMTISQMIDFFELHFDRHQRQIEKTIKIVHN